MKLFDSTITEVRDLVAEISKKEKARQFTADRAANWPGSDRGNIVLQSDTGTELGNPRDESLSLLLWTEDTSLVKADSITLIGPDAGEERDRLPFAKIVLLRVKDFDDLNCYERHREMELMRHDMSLSGYMIRATSQYMREWSRISKEAIRQGFCMETLGSALIKKYLQKDYITAAEVIFITSSPGDVKLMKGPAGKAQQLINAMNKMQEEMSFDCDVCDYTDVCSDVADLRSMRDNLKNRETAHEQ